jgi:hypothetical protein
MAEGSGRTIREAVGVFHDKSDFQDAIEELLRAGFDRAELSLLASEEAVESKLGDAYRRVQELEDEPEVPRAAYVGDHSLAEARTGVVGGLAYVGAMVGAGAVVASGGTLAAAIAAAALVGGGGGVLGGMAARWIGRDRAEQLENQLERGGLLLWVRVRDQAHEDKAVAILRRFRADDIHVHDLPLTRPSADNPFHGLEPDPWLPGARI